jgi:hypothetical protein
LTVPGQNAQKYCIFMHIKTTDLFHVFTLKVGIYCASSTLN